VSDVMARINDALDNLPALGLGLWAGIVLLALIVTGFAQLRPQRVKNDEWWPWDEES